MKLLPPPIIIIGMHRSGTSMITRMMESLGVFLGSYKNIFSEAVFFVNINDWILTQAGGRWDNPKPIKYLLNNQDIMSDIEKYFRDSLVSPKSIQYFGFKKFFLCVKGNRRLYKWGWKDPRNTFTLPIWRKIYPDAKIVHIYRHGVDVALSLNRRYKKEHVQKLNDYNSRKAFYMLINKHDGFTDSLRCSTLEGGFSLWEEYMEQANRQMDEIGDQGISIKYEEILNHPMENLEKIVNFCELDHKKEIVTDIAAGVNMERAYAFRKNTEYKNYANSVKERLSRYGYYV